MTRSTSAFDSSFSKFSPYCENLTGALEEYTAALGSLERAQANLRRAVDGNIQNEKSKQR